jgi:hypothetical protein
MLTKSLGVTPSAPSVVLNFFDLRRPALLISTLAFLFFALTEARLRSNLSCSSVPLTFKGWCFLAFFLAVRSSQAESGV